MGPHENPAKAVNVGVAAHLAAAAPGGPRFDATMSAESRASVENGIWLCQTCAKLIDSDSERYTSPVLAEWKTGAELLAIWELEGQANVRLTGANHSPLPLIYGVSYDEARAQLLANGWQPYMRHWSHNSDIEMRYGNGAVFWERGYRELASACPTGYAFCRFELKDVYGNKLAVITMGEEDPLACYHAVVVRWFFENEESPE